MRTIAEDLANYSSTLKYDDLPADVIHQAKRTIMDTLGCAFGSFDSEPATIARELAGLVSSSQPATVLCSGQKTSAELAAFANDVMIRYLDFNDTYVSKGTGHPSDSIAALFAAAEVARADGRELIVATVLAYEIYCAISDAWNNKASGIDHATMGAIASVVGVARLFGLTPQQIAEAINLVTVANITLAQTRLGHVSNWNACAYAYANRNAIFAAQLAARGMTGPAPIFEGRNGFFKIVSREPFELGPFGGDGRPFRIMRCDLRQFPLGNLSQTVVAAAVEARALVGDVIDIAEVNIHVSQKAIEIVAGDPEKWRPHNIETAFHSMPYAVAVALMYGTVEKKHFAEQYLNNRELLDLAARIRCIPSEEANRRSTEINLCDFDVITRPGERKSVRIEYHRGQWRNPMSDAEIEKKFRSLAANMLPDSRVDALVEQLWNLENLREIGTLIQMTGCGDKRGY